MFIMETELLCVSKIFTRIITSRYRLQKIMKVMIQITKDSNVSSIGRKFAGMVGFGDCNDLTSDYCFSLVLHQIIGLYMLRNSGFGIKFDLNDVIDIS